MADGVEMSTNPSFTFTNKTRQQVNELHTEDPQTLIVKQWWNKYGTTLVVAVVVSILALSGHRYWVSQQEKQAAQASLLYDEYQIALNTHDDEALQALSHSLKEDYKRTPYATAVTLIDAARDIQANKLDEATASLQWVIDKGSDYAKPIACLRLAELKLQQKDYEGAIALLKDPSDKAYVAPYQELTGDIYFAQAKTKEAIEEYNKALQGYKDLGFDNILLQYKVQTYAPTHMAGGQ
jgi:predicted negative regulator of RcsB-dependent stress response